MTSGRKSPVSDGTAPKQVRITFTPWKSGHTTATVVLRDWRNELKWDRHVGSLDLPVSLHDLTGLDAREVARALCAALVECAPIKPPPSA